MSVSPFIKYLELQSVNGVGSGFLWSGVGCTGLMRRGVGSVEERVL